MSEAVESQTARLDVITIGRASVDLYGQQIGSPARDWKTLPRSQSPLAVARPT